MSAPVIIGIAGAAGSGKSFLAQHLAQRWGFVRLSFADPLKEMLRVILRDFGYRDQMQLTRWIEGDLKETPCPALGGKSCRFALQTLGTEWGRHTIDPRLWTNLLINRLDGLPKVVVDDVRMDNEAEALLTHSPASYIYRVVPSLKATREPGQHASELGLSPGLITGADIVHDYTLKMLRAEVDKKIAVPLNLPLGASHAGSPTYR